MKLLLILPVLLLSLLSTGCSQAQAEPQTVTLQVKGMTCENCVKGIEGTLENTAGVMENEVSLEDRTATITYDANKLSPEKLAKRVSSLGYPASVESAQAE